MMEEKKENSENMEKKREKERWVEYQEYRGGKFKEGNPGRPRGTKNFSTIFDEAIKKIVKEKKLPVKDVEVEMVVRAIVEALKGNYAFYRDIMDRQYGRPKETIALEEDEKVDVVRVEIVKPLDKNDSKS